jgi:hypothetical protein
MIDEESLRRRLTDLDRYTPEEIEDIIADYADDAVEDERNDPED